VVIRAHHEQAILDRYRDDQRPKDQRQGAERGLRRELISHDVDDSLQRIKRAGSEIAVDDAQREKCSPDSGWLVKLVMSISRKSGRAVQCRNGRCGHDASDVNVKDLFIHETYTNISHCSGTLRQSGTADAGGARLARWRRRYSLSIIRIRPSPVTTRPFAVTAT